MGTLGIIFTILNGSVAIVVGIIAKATDRRIDAESAIKKALKLTYLQFGRTVANALPELEEVNDFTFQELDGAAKEMGRWHYQSIVDLLQVKIIERIVLVVCQD